MTELEEIDFDMKKYAKYVDELRAVAVISCKQDGHRALLEIKTANALDRTMEHLKVWMQKNNKREEL